MAAHMRCVSTVICQTRFTPSSLRLRHKLQYMYTNNRGISFKQQPTNCLQKYFSVGNVYKSRVWGLTFAAGLGLVYLGDLYRRTTTVFANDGPFKHKPIRSVRSDCDGTGLRLTLFQYQTCPFCCKVRAFLDYHGFSYDVVEVNSVWRTQTKWTKYPKVPVMVVKGIGPDGYLQINDSSVIISMLATFLEDSSMPLDKILDYYPSIEDPKKRPHLDYPNRYFVMLGDKVVDISVADELKEERKWREWTDNHLVHVLSPNIYKTIRESKEAFEYFDKAGQWEKVFSKSERYLITNVGAFIMFLIGNMLKKRHNLGWDVRDSLYESCTMWTKAIGEDRTFMGGDQPNLADLSVYGVLNAMEGCTAFTDTLKNTDIGPWYLKMKEAIQNKAGHTVDKHINS